MTPEHTKCFYNLMDSIIFVKKKITCREKKKTIARIALFTTCFNKKVIILALENNKIST